MAAPPFISRLLKALTPRPTGGGQTVPPALVEWPLPTATPVLLLGVAADPPIQARSRQRGIRVFAYPFDLPDIAGLVASVPSPEVGRAPDGKYCEFVGADRSLRYFACRALIETLERAKGTAGMGLTRLRWVALDEFDYPNEAAPLYALFEEEAGPARTAMGLARVVMNRRPARALALLDDAGRRGISGAAMSACRARVLSACGRLSEGVTAAALALRQLPDPLWMPADHMYSWGLLHGAAQASVLDEALRENVLAAIHSLAEPPASARRVLACAALFEAASDASAAAHHADMARHLVGADEALRAGAGAMLQRVRPDLAVTTDSAAASNAQDQAFQAIAGAMYGHPDDPDDAVVVSAGPVFDGADLSDIVAARNYCRQIADAWGGGLVDADVVDTPAGRAIQLIYKKSRGTGFEFTGVQILPQAEATQLSTVCAGEGHTTGMREATVTAYLMQQGLMTIETYKSSWARDPYDVTYRNSRGVPQRYLSDDVVYDRMFRGHPLARVRRVLRRLAAGTP